MNENMTIYSPETVEEQRKLAGIIEENPEIVPELVNYAMGYLAGMSRAKSEEA